MSVYVDYLRPCIPTDAWPHRQACHLTGDDRDELDVFALRLGLRLGWRQRSRSGIYHYDLTASKRRQALNLGAIEIRGQLPDGTRILMSANETNGARR